MSLFAKSLRTRIQEITASVETQKSELAAYERLLQIELAKEGTATTTESPSEIRPTPTIEPANMANITFTGNKTTLVADIVKRHGSSGASPKDVDKVFSARKIKRSKNFIYNTLSYLAVQKKLERREGRYFAIITSPASTNHSTPPIKRRLSGAGLKRIREGVKKRWAAKRAADRAAAKK
jgi:hypothetical protein